MPPPAHLLNKLNSAVASERNAAAIALMDIGDSSAIPLLIEAIEHPDNRAARGTLIYALSAFDCHGRFAQIFRWAIEGGYEASGEALSIIQQQELRPTAIDLPVCRALLSSAALDDGALVELSALVQDHEG
jgi:hypothetical protein